MAYISQGDLDVLVSDEDLIGLTDDASSGIISTAIVNEVIIDAQAEIDTFINSKYLTPLVSVPEAVKRWCVVLAVLRLFQRRRNVPDAIQTEANSVRSQLKMVADGKLTLEIGGEDAPASSATNTPVFNYNDRTFSRTNFRSW